MRSITARLAIGAALVVAIAACDPTKKVAPTFSLDGKYVLQSISGVSMPFEYFRLVGRGYEEYDTLYIDTLRINTDSSWSEFMHHRITINGTVTTSVVSFQGRWDRTSDSVTLTTGPSDVNGPHVFPGSWVPGILTLHSVPATFVYYGGGH